MFSIRVVSDIQPSAHFAFPKPEYMHEWAIDRLRKSSLLTVLDGGFANRRDAINHAKSETEAYVLLLQLQDSPSSPGAAAERPAAGQMWIDLSILIPGSGKAKHTKRITLNEELRQGLPPSILRTCRTGIFGNDYLLLEASLKAAEHVMSLFNIPIPPDCPRP